jgi:hypothetical protein
MLKKMVPTFSEDQAELFANFLVQVILPKNGLGYILGDFFTSYSCHPALNFFQNSVQRKFVDPNIHRPTL